jgi:Pentapeptide repeats (8 copies)
MTNDASPEPTLISEAASFLEADDWVVSQRDPSFIVGSRQGYGDASDQVLIWVPQQGLTPEQLRLREDGYLRRFAEEAGTYGQKHLLVESTEGLSADFRRRARGDFGVSLTVATDFFDAPFKWDRSRSTATAASELRRSGQRDLTERIAQPFESSRAYQSHEDMLQVLLPEFRSSNDGPPVHLVTAPAGFGKSHLFHSLYAQLYDDFMAAKSEERRALRPLPLLPEYLASASAPTLKALVQSFLTTEVARPLRLESFEWMLIHGFASFLLDGLDEVIARDPHFFEYIYEQLTRPDAPRRPKILICVRDSLLVSNRGLRDFLDDAGPDLVVRHRLAPWREPSIDSYASRNLPEPKAGQLIELLGDEPNLMGLAGTPFYCEILASEVGHGLESAELRGAETETTLLALAVRRMINREFDKGLLKKSWADVADIESFVKDIAEENLRAEGKGVSVDDVAELAEVILSPTIGEADIEEAVQAIEQLPFFTGSIDLGRLSFSQEVVYDYLLGTLAKDYFASNPRRFLQLLGVVPFSPSSVTVHVIREHVQAINGLDDLYRIAQDAVPDRVAFRNVLQILLTLPDAEWVIRRLPLERRDLSGLSFDGMDMTGTSLRSANLESTTFQDCTLTSAILADAVIKGTEFVGCTGLERADFGDLSTFFSAVVDGHGIEEPDQFLRSVGVLPGPANSRYVKPCGAARQLRFLFSKYVRPDGIARRNWLDERGALAGRRYMDPKSVVDAARRHGYIEWDPVRKRYTRSVGEQYSEMIGLVSKMQITPRLRLLLSDVCSQTGCSHVLTTARI